MLLAVLTFFSPIVDDLVGVMYTISFNHHLHLPPYFVVLS